MDRDSQETKMPETPRIRWQEEYPGTLFGRVGTLETWAFELWRSSGHCGDYEPGDWVLTTPFLFKTEDGGRCTLSGRDPEKLKADAEELLAEFTAALGASSPQEA
jgi:hypothetical protein